MGLERTIGNRRYDILHPDEGFSTVLGKVGNTTTVIRPDGQMAWERQIGRTRYSSDQDGFSNLF